MNTEKFNTNVNERETQTVSQKNKMPVWCKVVAILAMIICLPDVFWGLEALGGFLKDFGLVMLLTGIIGIISAILILAGKKAAIITLSLGIILFIRFLILSGFNVNSLSDAGNLIFFLLLALPPLLLLTTLPVLLKRKK